MEQYKEQEELVGPRPEDNERSEKEELTSNGEPLWMAFLSDPDAITITPDEVHEAKNAFAQMKQLHPEVIQMCTRKSPQECKTLIEEIKKAA